MKPAAFFGLIAVVVFGYIVYSQDLSLIDLISPTKLLPSVSASPSASPRTSGLPVSSQKTGDSGITGVALMGPTCPVQKDPPDPKCADAPYQGAFVVRRDGQIVTTFTTSSSGSFRVKLAPGTYYINKSSSAVYPTFSPMYVIVRSGEFTNLTLQLDSGIR